MEIIGYVLLAVFAVGVLVLAWKQAKEADLRSALPDNDLDVRRRYNAEQARLAKLRDAYHRGIGA